MGSVRSRGRQRGQGRYQVRPEVRDARGRSLVTRMLRGGQGNRPAAMLEYDRTGQPSGDRAVEWVILTGDWEPSRYQLILRLEDLVAQRSATARAEFVVSPPSRGRGDGPPARPQNPGRGPDGPRRCRRVS
jgi:hypothetical protein